MFLYVVTNKLTKLSEMKRKELDVCYWLNYVKQHPDLLKEGGYNSIYTYAGSVLGYSKATVDKYVKIGELYTYKDGDNKIHGVLNGFRVSQLLELLTLNKENVVRLVDSGFIGADMTTASLRELVKELKSKYPNS